MGYPAVLYDPQGVTRRVSVAWNSAPDGSLYVEDAAGVTCDIPAAQLSLTRGGWNSEAITLAWEENGRAWAVTVTDQQAVTQLAKELPSHFSEKITYWQKQSQRSERWSNAVLTCFGLLAFLPLLILFALFMMRDRILDAVITQMPTSIDVRIGDLMEAQLRQAGELVTEGPAVEAVRTVGQRLVMYLPKNDFNFRFEVVNDPSINAFAAPGGLVIVHTGLLAKLTSVDQLIGVVGHEVTHVTHRHSLRQVVYNLGLSTTLRWLLGVPDGVADTLAGAAANLSGLKFSREQESEADRGGVELLQKARLPATGLQSFFDVLAKERGSIPSFLSTHPADQERATVLQRLIQEHGQWEIQPLRIDWETVRRDAEDRIKKK